VSSRGEPIGVISTYFEQPHRPSDDEMIAMALFARHAADQIARRRLEETLKAAEERQWLLAREMDHRFGNVFGIVQSIARQMQRVAPTPAAFVSGFNERLAAFAHAQALLTKSEWRGAEIVSLAHKQLMVDDADPSLVCKGRSLNLPANAALVLALALHELGTNARKYGAWTVPGGRVTLSWNVEPTDAGETLKLCWRESRGPRVMPPTREGFGSTLLRRAFAVAGGRTPTLRFEPEGVVCDMYLPLRGFPRQ
jgi:two-component sensor histidine kinase